MIKSSTSNRNLEKLLTPQQAAEILGVSPGTLDVWRTQDVIVCHTFE